jgi:hypothetical protein
MILDSVWLCHHVNFRNVGNLFAQEVETISKTVQDGFHTHSVALLLKDEDVELSDCTSSPVADTSTFAEYGVE